MKILNSLAWVLLFALQVNAQIDFKNFVLDDFAHSDSAIEYFTKMIAQENNEPLWYISRSYVYALNGKLKKARKDLDKGIKMYETPSDTLFDYSARLYASSGKFKKALAESK